MSVGTTASDGSGAWSFTPGVAWADATYSLTATATDAANNTSGLSNTVALTIDTGVPAALVIVSPVTGTTTSDNTPTISGTAEANSTVTVYRDGVSVGTTASDGSGAWSFTPGTSWADGTYSLTATATDAANNTSGPSNTVVLTIDTTPPPQDTDSDGDGVTDAQEILDGTNPNSPDSDSDGLTDSEEKEQSTNPNDSDSDDDSVTDGEEIQAGTNPRDRGSVKALRDTTLCTEWNGFLEMLNVLEHINQGTNKLRLESTLHNIFGKEQGTASFGVKPGYQYDLVVRARHKRLLTGTACR